jgi:inhibitor of the pro-sigma K processing machinery
MAAAATINPLWVMAGTFALLVAYTIGRLVPGLGRWLLTVGGRAAAGMGALAGWDALARHLGLAVGINPATAITIGVLGVPGFLLILALRLFVFHR